MKLVRCHIINYGILHDFDYEFDDGINIILEANGWGKTTFASYLKAMLYGFDSKRSKDITENERKRYRPWQGGEFGGSLDFELKGKTYRVYRTFGDTPRSDKVKIIDLDSGATARINSENLGESLFGIDVNAFQRSVYINQNGFNIDGAASSLHSRLNSIVSQANDLTRFDKVISNLTKQSKEFEKIGQKGIIGDINRKIIEKENAKNKLEFAISQKQTLQDQLLELSEGIKSLDEKLKGNKTILEHFSSDEKTRSANSKLLEEINVQISELDDQRNKILCLYSGHFPTELEIAEITGTKKNLESEKQSFVKKTAELEEMEAGYNDLLEKYAGVLPTDDETEELQRIIADLKALEDSDKSKDKKVEIPEEYEKLIGCVSNDETKKTMIDTLTSSKGDIQDLIVEKARKEETLKTVTEKYEANEKRIGAVIHKIETCERELADLELYASEGVGELVSVIKERQASEQNLWLKKHQLEEQNLSDEDKSVYELFSRNKPSLEMGEKLLATIRLMQQKKIAFSKYEADLDSQRIRLESLETTAESLKAESGVLEMPLAPNPVNTVPVLIIGIVIILAAIVAGIVVNPVLFVAVLIGVVLAGIAIKMSRNYKSKLEQYNEQMTEYNRQKSISDRRKDLDEQVIQTRRRYDELYDQYEQHEKELNEAEKEIEKLSHEIGFNAPCSEKEVVSYLDNARMWDSIKAKQSAYTTINDEISALQSKVDSLKEKETLFGIDLSDVEENKKVEFLTEKRKSYELKKENAIDLLKERDSLLVELGVEEYNDEALKKPVIEATNSLNSANEALDKIVESDNLLLLPLGIRMDSANAVEVIDKIQKDISECEKLLSVQKMNVKQSEEFEKKRSQLKSDLSNHRLMELDCFASDNPEDKLKEIRTDVFSSNDFLKKIGVIRSEVEKGSASLFEKEKDLDSKLKNLFGDNYEVDLDKVSQDIAEAKTIENKMSGMNLQKESVQKELDKLNKKFEVSVGYDEITGIISKQEKQRDELRDNYVNTNDQILQIDDSISLYNDCMIEIRELYEEKRRATASLETLKRTIFLISKAKENLATRYLDRVQALFNDYIQIWLDNEDIKGIIDIDFNVSIEEKGLSHVAEGYSTGYCDLLDFCMRLALVDTVFESESPFLIMDDPFVNLDSERLGKALNMMSILSSDKQVIYFVCHPIRSSSSSVENYKNELDKLMKEARKRRVSVAKKASSGKQKKSLRDKYVVDASKRSPCIRPTGPIVITNSIFFVSFEKDGSFAGDVTYELFFIDSNGHVLNDRQNIEIKSGELSTNKLMFSLRTREDSGLQYELIIREPSQEDYNILCRIPVKANLALTGSFDFE